MASNPFDTYGNDQYHPSPIPRVWAPTKPSYSTDLYEDVLRGDQAGVPTTYQPLHYNPDFIPDPRQPIRNPNFSRRFDDYKKTNCTNGGGINLYGMHSPNLYEGFQSDSVTVSPMLVFMLFILVVLVYCCHCFNKSLSAIMDKLNTMSGATPPPFGQ